MEGRIIYKLLLILPFSSQGITPYDPCRGKEKNLTIPKKSLLFPSDLVSAWYYLPTQDNHI